MKGFARDYAGNIIEKTAAVVGCNAVLAASELKQVNLGERHQTSHC